MRRLVQLAISTYPIRLLSYRMYHLNTHRYRRYEYFVNKTVVQLLYCSSHVDDLLPAFVAPNAVSCHYGSLAYIHIFLN